jgi:[acyl-carrier-protein] S-malonyltransferase
MLAAWLELPGTAEKLERWSEASGVDLVRHGTVSDAATIRDTAITQPLLAAAALLSYQALRDAVGALGTDLAAGVRLVAGHSIGEFPAAVIAGTLDAQAAMELVGLRGREMAACAAARPTGMAAVVGGTPDDVLAAIEASGASAANPNGPGQIVAAGSLDQLDRLGAAPPAGARVIRLDVAGAFHTAHMAAARDALAQAAATIDRRPAAIGLLANTGAALLTDADAIVDQLVTQVTAPVRWDLAQAALGGLGVDRVIELAPAGVLAGLLRRAKPPIPALKITSPADVPAAAQAVAEAAEEAAAAGTDRAGRAEPALAEAARA